jgi:uncharacterized protein (TIGR02246 family)
MRTLSLLFGAALCMGQVCFTPAGDQVVPRAEKAKAAAPAKNVEAHESTTGATVAEAIPGNTPLTEQQIQEIEAIRLTDESFAKAYAAGDAAAVAAHFTVDAEYVDELGNVFQGRPAIEESLKTFFEENSSCILEMNIDTVRFISPGIAVEDGSTTMNRGDNGDPIDSRYTTVHVKADGKWLAASVRDHAPKDRRQHKVQLEQLSWLMGDWIDEGDDSIVSFSCKATDSGNFLLREFAIEIAGRKAMSGTQRIGWDPLTGKLRGWIFDSEGAYAEGLWHRDEDSWVLKTIGVTADGQAASSTSIYRQINDHTMTWQSIDYEIGGVQIPDSEIYTIVRQAPVPTVDAASPAVTQDDK